MDHPTEWRARALDVTDGPRVDAGVLMSHFDGCRLAVDTRSGEANLRGSIVVDAAAAITAKI